jgi:integrase
MFAALFFKPNVMSLQGQRTTTTAMSWDDFKSLISKLERDKEYKFCLLISIGCFTGLRIGDLLLLRFSHFENTNILTIQERKTKKVRRIKINPDLRAIIDRVRIKMGITESSQYIFLNRYGTKPIDQSYVNVKLKEIFKKYDITIEGNISSHMFRKTLGNRVLKLNNYSSKSIVLLMELFSHRSVTTTKFYLGVRESEIMDVYDSLRL